MTLPQIIEQLHQIEIVVFKLSEFRPTTEGERAIQSFMEELHYSLDTVVAELLKLQIQQEKTDA